MINPIIKREVQTSLRTWKLFFSIFLYVAMLLLVTWIFLDMQLSQAVYGGFSPASVRYLYGILAGVQMVFVYLAVPSLTAGSISGEREKQTLDILLTTKMRPFSIVFGKLAAGVGLVFLMLLSALPVYAALYYFGGIPIGYLLGATGFAIVSAIFVGAISVFFSCLYQRTMIAMLLTYLFCALLLFGTAGGYLVYYIEVMNQATATMQAQPSHAVFYVLFALNPGAGFAEILVRLFQNMTLNQVFASGLSNGVMGNVPIWVVNVISELAASVGLLSLAARRINPLRRR